VKKRKRCLCIRSGKKPGEPVLLGLLALKASNGIRLANKKTKPGGGPFPIFPLRKKPRTKLGPGGGGQAELRDKRGEDSGNFVFPGFLGFLGPTRGGRLWARAFFYRTSGGGGQNFGGGRKKLSFSGFF